MLNVDLKNDISQLSFLRQAKQLVDVNQQQTAREQRDGELTPREVFVIEGRQSVPLKTEGLSGPHVTESHSRTKSQGSFLSQ